MASIAASTSARLGPQGHRALAERRRGRRSRPATWRARPLADELRAHLQLLARGARAPPSAPRRGATAAGTPPHHRSAPDGPAGAPGRRACRWRRARRRREGTTAARRCARSTSSPPSRRSTISRDVPRSRRRLLGDEVLGEDEVEVRDEHGGIVGIACRLATAILSGRSTEILCRCAARHSASVRHVLSRQFAPVPRRGAYATGWAPARHSIRLATRAVAGVGAHVHAHR